MLPFQGQILESSSSCRKRRACRFCSSRTIWALWRKCPIVPSSCSAAMWWKRYDGRYLPSRPAPVYARAAFCSADAWLNEGKGTPRPFPDHRHQDRRKPAAVEVKDTVAGGKTPILSVKDLTTDLIFAQVFSVANPALYMRWRKSRSIWLRGKPFAGWRIRLRPNPRRAVYHAVDRADFGRCYARRLRGAEARQDDAAHDAP